MNYFGQYGTLNNKKGREYEMLLFLLLPKNVVVYIRDPRFYWETWESLKLILPWG